MAPSSALLLLLFGTVTALSISARGAPYRRLIAASAGAGVLAAVALLVASTLGISPGIEHLGLQIPGRVAGVPVGHISPVTALGFVLAGLSVLLSTAAARSAVRAGFGVAVVVMLLGATLTLAYALSRPAFYDGAIIPPALSTAMGFVLLGGALMGVAGRRWLSNATSRDPAPLSVVRLALVIGVAAAVIVTPAVVLFRSYEAEFHQAVEAHQLAIADLKVDQITDWRSERISDGHSFQSNPLFARQFDGAFYRGDHEAGQRLDLWLIPLRARPEYARVTLVDSAGRERRPGPASAVTASGASRVSSAAVRAMRSGRVDLYAGNDSSGAGELEVTLVAPVADSAGRSLGAVVMTIDPAIFLRPLVRSASKPSRTGETLLVLGDGNHVLYSNDPPGDSGSGSSLRRPLRPSELYSQPAAFGAEGIFYGVDHRGQRVVAVLRAIPGSDWTLVTAIAVSEIYGPLRSRHAWTVSLVILLLLGLIGAIVFVWQQREMSYYRKLAGAEDRYRSLVYSIGDAVIATDADGVVELINPVAEQLTGWPSQDGVGRKLEDVFRIVNQDTREPAENPVAKVLRHGKTVSLANHTILISRSGRHLPIVDSGAPVRSADGALIGVVLAFRDRTEEWNARLALEEEILRSQRNEAKYRNLFVSIRDAILVADTNQLIVDCNPACTELLGYDAAELIGRPTRDLFESAEEHARLARELRADIGTRTSLATIRYRRKSGEVVAGETNAFHLEDTDGRVIGFIGLIRDVTERLRTEEANRAQLVELRRWQAVMLDREERLLQLKQKINSLHARLGEPAPYQTTQTPESSAANLQ